VSNVGSGFGSSIEPNLGMDVGPSVGLSVRVEGEESLIGRKGVSSDDESLIGTVVLQYCVEVPHQPQGEQQ